MESHPAMWERGNWRHRLLFTSIDPEIGTRRITSNKIKDVWPKTELYLKKKVQREMGRLLKESNETDNEIKNC
jgi:hypothetical protein